MQLITILLSPEDRKGGGGRPSGGARCMPKPNIAFEWGRVDCATAPSTTEEGPEAEPDMDRDEMLAVFKDNFGFEPEQVKMRWIWNMHIIIKLCR